MDQVSQVREKTDIVSLINEYVPLKKAGANFKALCPFHTDKTPSFVVSPQRQIWHCFGCSKGGDCYSFLMEYEHIEFPESLRILADKAGVTLENQRFDSHITSQKEKLYSINHLASEFYHYLLTKHTLGKGAYEYVLGRDIKPQTVNTYMLGFSPHGNSLVTYLIKKKHISLDDIFDAGLASRRGREVIDFFQGRLMFPLHDHRGNIIGFSGRVLNASDSSSKYINTRETLIYHKGYTFFGLNSAKDSIKRLQTAILMEGEFDVISAFQEGITNAVAVKGTALTLDQVNLLARFCTKVQLCFDTDSAGQEALKRSLPLLEKKGLTTTVLILPTGKDPDELIKKDPIAFKKAIKSDVPAYEYILEKAQEVYNPSSVLGKKEIGDTMLPLFMSIDNEIVKEHYLQLLSKTISTSYDSLLKAMDKLQKEKVIRNEEIQLPAAKSREERLEEYLVALIVQSPSPLVLLALLKDFMQEYDWHIPSLAKVLFHVEKFLTTHPHLLAKDAVDGMPEELLSAFDTSFLLPVLNIDNEELIKKEIENTKKELYTLFVKAQMKKIAETIKSKEKEGNIEDVENLQTEFTRLAKLLDTK